jgi:hypothetical protein
VTPSAQRKVLRNKKARALLVRYSQGRPTQQLAKLTYKELKRLIKLLESDAADLSAVPAAEPGSTVTRVQRRSRNGPRAVAEMLKGLLAGHEAEHTPDGHLASPTPYRQVLYALASDHTSDTVLVGTQASYDALLHLVQQGALGQMQQHRSETSAVLLHAGTLGRMLLELQPAWAQGSFFTAVTDLARSLLYLWYEVIGSTSPDDSTSQPLPEEHPARAQQDEVASYHSLPLRYSRPQYSSYEHEDGRSTQTSWYRKCDNTQPRVGTGQRKFSPGLFKVTCVHGFVYGFHFLREPESPSDFFTLLLTRFPRDKLPALVYYDNGCKLYEYILNREPWMLKSICVLVDSFHYGSWRGAAPVHKCPTTFDTKAHAQAALFNSQYEEHGNAFISIHKRTARTMQLQRAWQLVGALLRCRNGIKAGSMQATEELRAAYMEACDRLGVYWYLQEERRRKEEEEEGEGLGQQE